MASAAAAAAADAWPELLIAEPCTTDLAKLQASLQDGQRVDRMRIKMRADTDEQARAQLEALLAFFTESLPDLRLHTVALHWFSSKHPALPDWSRIAHVCARIGATQRACEHFELH